MPPYLSRVRAAAVLPVLLVLHACGGSSAVTNVTSPTTITRCPITLQPFDGQVPAQGGTGSITVGAARDCTWSASTEGPWLAIRSGANGQGDGAVEFSATANPDPAVRRGAVVLNGQRAEITQAAAACTITLGESAASFGQAGGNGTVPVRASSQLCTWNATADAEWINVRTASGAGNGQVAFEVLATTGPPRTGTITVAGQRFSITQAEGCAYAIAPMSQTVPASGGAGTVAITTTPACPWTAGSNAEWLTVTPAAGSGPAAVAFSVAPTTGVARTGTAVIAGQIFTVSQGQGCTYDVQPATATIPAAGGSASISIATNAQCPWTVASEADWLAVQGRSSGAGAATITLAAAASTGPARTGTALVAGQRVSVTQAGGCTFTISPESATVPSAGGSGKVSVTTSAGCAWTAASSASWLTISAGANGSGSGEVQYTAAATTGPGRSATLTIGGRTFTLNQGEGCAYTLSPASATVDDSGGQGTFTVQSSAGCAWTAAAQVPWLTITSGASGSGTGQVRFTAAANSGPSRSGAITAGGQTFTVQQGNGCSYAISPTSQSVPAGGGNGTVSVTAGSGCSWSATSNAGWLSITSGGSGTGNGSVAFTAAANAGPQRSGTLTIGGRTFTVSQAEGCTYSINPEQASVGGAGGNVAVSVTSPGGCGWTASSTTGWIRITSGSSGSGNGTVQVSVDPNTGAARSATISIAGRSFAVTQSSGCSYAINPSAQNAPAAGGALAPVSVTAGDSCAWTASSAVPWLTVTSGASGTGNGTVQIEAQANTGGPRTGTATIAGQTFTVSQAGGCSYAIAPTSQNAPSGGGPLAPVSVTTDASCAWTAASAVPWLTVTSGASGTGSGSVQIEAQANTGAPRSGSVTIAGQPFTVNQAGGCTYAINPTASSAAAGAGAVAVAVTAGDTCGWTAVSNAAWLTVSAGASGTGNGSVQIDVQANAGPARTGTVTIAGQAFTLTQDSGCTYSITPAAQPAPAAGGTLSVTVSTVDGCPWTAASNVAWITITNAGPGAGAGSVTFSVQPNGTGAPRSGTLTVAGQTHTVNQE